MYGVVYAVGSLLALALSVAAFWPWERPVRSAPLWAPVVVVATGVTAVVLADPHEMGLVLAVWPILVGLFVLAVRLHARWGARRADELRSRGRGG
ncbi:hypothetical protein [Oryzobacter terrae]|uniref:hypothetical protein n=1 Tax=Oryzobacter terrae TaxID=1620385 RepID=UPI0036711964